LITEEESRTMTRDERKESMKGKRLSEKAPEEEGGFSSSPAEQKKVFSKEKSFESGRRREEKASSKIGLGQEGTVRFDR